MLVENRSFEGVKKESSLLFGSEEIVRLDGCGGPVLLLDAKKEGAFRAGVPGKRGEWSRENRGPASVAFGERTVARGRGAFAHGTAVEVGGQWNTGLGVGVTVADSPNIQANLAAGTNLSLTSSECGKVASNLVGGKCNTLISKCRADGNVIGGCSNTVVDSCNNFIGGCSNTVKDVQRNLIQGHCMQLEGVHDSLVVGIGHSNSCHTGTAVVAGSYNKTGPQHYDGLTVGCNLSNNMPGVVLVGRNGEARTSPSYNYSFQLAGGCEGSKPGVGLVLHTASHGAVPVQNGLTTGNWQSSCTGYSEYFEWHDGNPSNEDRVGLFVTLNRDKIALATCNKDVVGVVTWSAAFVGNSHELAWCQANLKDDYGRYCFEFEDDYEGIISLIRRYLDPEREDGGDECRAGSEGRERREKGERGEKGRRERDGKGRRERDGKGKERSERSDRSESGRRSERRNSDDYSERSRRLSDEYSDYSESHSDRSEKDDSERRSLADSRSERSESESSERRARRERREKGEKSESCELKVEASLQISISLKIYRSLCELPRDGTFIRRCCELLPWLKEEIARIPKKRVNKVNRNYRNENYCPRSDRKEWETVTLLGRVTVRQNGSCREGEKVDCVNGIAVPGSGWRVLKVQERTVQILFTGPALRG